MTTATAEQAILDAVKPQLYIGGEWRDGGEGATLEVEDPATGETLVEVADATVDDAKAALGAAHETFAQWRDTPPRERGDILRRAYDVITERADDLALLMTLEMGKPVAESKAEIAYAANFFRWYAEEAVRINGRFTVNEAGAGRVLTLKQPVGPCVFITPWNFPLAMGTRKIGPAIAAGCTMVVKPAKQTPLSMLMLAQILEEVGLPGGVVNVITAQVVGAHDGAAHQGPAHAQAVVHRLDRGRAHAHPAVGRPGPARVDGARRQRALPGLRRRRRRRGRRGRADRQDAQRRRGVHVGQPLPRRRRRGAGVRREARREDRAR